MSFLLLGVAFLGPNDVFAQTQVRLISADQLIGGESELGAVRKLLGNVEMETDDFYLKADSVYQYLEQDLVDAFGNIDIETESQRIWADSLRYNTASDQSHFRGRVVVEGRSTRLFSQEMLYNFFFEIAEFPEKIRLEDRDGELRADRGLYFSLADSAAFFGNVQLSDSTQYAESDSLFAVRSRKQYELNGRVYLENKDNNSRMRADFSRSDSTGFRELIGNTRLQRVNEAETDTTFLTSHRMEIIDRDSLSAVDAFENVRIWSPRYASASDEARYNDEDEVFFLESDARLWQESTQLSSENINIQLQEDEIKYLKAYPRAISVQPDSITGRFNQIVGDTLTMYFNSDELERIEVNPNTEMIAHEKDESGKPEFAMRIRSEILKVYFNEGAIDSLKYFEAIDGEYIPEAQEPGSIRLNEFLYDPDMKPERPENWLQPRLGYPEPVPPFKWPARYQEYLDAKTEEQ
jgi:lipopolysaccharide export system protein LptA